MALIAVDIDSTLYDFEAPLRQAFLDLALETSNKEYFRGAYQSWVEWRSPADVCGPEAFSEALKRVHSPEVILSQVPFPHAWQTLYKLVEQGHELLYISNRDEDVWSPTRGWLHSTGFPDGELICTLESKTSFMLDCQYLIDDRPKTLCDFVYNRHWSGERRAFGLLYEYNRALTDIPEIYLAPTWAGIQYYLEREGVLTDGTYYRADSAGAA